MTIVQHSSQSSDWFTPARYAEAAREVMGDIDLDPASCVEANAAIGARKFFTPEDDGLAQPWHGRVFLNPPYGRTTLNGVVRSSVEVWTHKLRHEFSIGNVSEAILLVNATPAQRWFQALWQWPICFPNHRIRFWRVDSVNKAPTHSNCFVAIGYRADLPNDFIRHFSEFGPIVRRVG